ncbi:MAG: endonuclease MutS2 [Deltaproteobacteria bacterium]|nr:endonuclease MutS2 [Deltaproteobacteria bacterium]
MDSKTLRTLEFDRIQEILKRYAASSPGISEIEHLRIGHQPESIRQSLACVREMRFLLQNRGRLSLQGNEEIRPCLQSIRVEGASLKTDDLVLLRKVIRTGQVVKDTLDGEKETCPLLHREARRLESFRGLGEIIDRTIDERGRLRDSASPDLQRIRRRMQTLRQSVRTRLEEILSSASLGPMVQEKLVTIRNGRYVIPLKPDFSGKLSGIIHDRSASGQTVYVEPAATVEMNNRLSRLLSEETAEIRKILLRITEKVRGAGEGLARNVAVLARFDLHQAKALYAETIKGVNPKLVDSKMIDFQQARHPLLLQRTAPDGRKPVVPVDLRLGETCTTLLITGPNTGGKTVALKTLGLLVLMAQAGIPVPVAEGSRMGVFREVMADIGDAQSIQEDLSTFSSHIENIVSILKGAEEGALVLLDELGTGTDPREGAALGIAILEKLENSGCLTAATTHYEEVKQFAYTRRGMMNASMAFDREHLRPTYTLLYGHLGTSHAFEVSERLGIPHAVLRRAREEISDFDRNRDHLIEELEGRIAETRTQAKSLLQKEKRIEILKKEIEEEKEKTRKETEKILAEARAKVDRTRKQVRKILKAAGRQADRSRLEKELTELQKELPEEEQVIRTNRNAPLPNIPVGCTVEVMGTGKQGVILNRPNRKGRVRILCNGIRMEVPAARLQEISPDTPLRGVVVKLDAEEHQEVEVPSRINLLGLRVEEAVRKTVHYIDQAHMNCMRHVEIVHGIGTGALRRAVAETLEAHPLVMHFENSGDNHGGAGVTMVQLVS